MKTMYCSAHRLPVALPARNSLASYTGTARRLFRAGSSSYKSYRWAHVRCSAANNYGDQPSTGTTIVAGAAAAAKVQADESLLAEAKGARSDSGSGSSSAAGVQTWLSGSSSSGEPDYILFTADELQYTPEEFVALALQANASVVKSSSQSSAAASRDSYGETSSGSSSSSSSGGGDGDGGGRFDNVSSSAGTSSTQVSRRSSEDSSSSSTAGSTSITAATDTDAEGRLDDVTNGRPPAAAAAEFSVTNNDNGKDNEDSKTGLASSSNTSNNSSNSPVTAAADSMTQLASTALSAGQNSAYPAGFDSNEVDSIMFVGSSVDYASIDRKSGEDFVETAGSDSSNSNGSLDSKGIAAADNSSSNARVLLTVSSTTNSSDCSINGSSNDREGSNDSSSSHRVVQEAAGPAGTQAADGAIDAIAPSTSPSCTSSVSAGDTEEATPTSASNTGASNADLLVADITCASTVTASTSGGSRINSGDDMAMDASPIAAATDSTSSELCGYSGSSSDHDLVQQHQLTAKASTTVTSTDSSCNSNSEYGDCIGWRAEAGTASDSRSSTNGDVADDTPTAFISSANSGSSSTDNDRVKQQGQPPAVDLAAGPAGEASPYLLPGITADQVEAAVVTLGASNIDSSGILGLTAAEVQDGTASNVSSISSGSGSSSSGGSGTDDEQQPQPVSGFVPVAVGSADEASDDLIPGSAMAPGTQQDDEGQGYYNPLPLIDPDVDIANDPAYTIRLLDILDQVSVDGGSGSYSSMSSVEVAGDGEAAGEQQQQEWQHASAGGFARQPSMFCTNCCTPYQPSNPEPYCLACGHSAADDHLLFSLGVSSAADRSAHSPQWLLLQQHGAKAAAAVRAGPGSDTVYSSSPARVPAAPAIDLEQVQLRREAGGALRRARELLQDAGVLQLPSTLLAWEEDYSESEEPAMLMHRGLLPPNHERPERLRVILARLRAAGLLDCCDRLAPREATDDELLSVHTPDLVAAVAALSHANMPADLNQVAAHLAPDMLGNRFTYRAARTAAGTAAELARQLVLGGASNGMALVRPVGHSAGVDTGEAGSYFNNVAVAARAAQRAGARRVIIVDWDIHYGKGTADIFAGDQNVVYLSLHRYGSSFYPGSGAAEHVGNGRAKGKTINVAWTPPAVTDRRGRRVQVAGCPLSDGDYLAAWHLLVLPVVSEFKPDIILVSAGFDAADKDPIGQYRVHPECFGHLTALLMPHAPVGLVLEGGYNLAVTAACVESCVRALMGEQPALLPSSRIPGVTGWASIMRTLLIQQAHWKSLSLLNYLQLVGPVPSGEAEDAGAWADNENDVMSDDSDEGECEYYEEWEEAEQEADLAAAAQDTAGGDSSSTEQTAAHGQAGGQLQTSLLGVELAPDQIVGVLQQSPDLLQQVLDLLDNKMAAGPTVAAATAVVIPGIENIGADDSCEGSGSSTRSSSDGSATSSSRGAFLQPQGEQQEQLSVSLPFSDSSTDSSSSSKNSQMHQLQNGPDTVIESSNSSTIAAASYGIEVGELQAQEQQQPQEQQPVLSHNGMRQQSGHQLALGATAIASSISEGIDNSSVIPTASSAEQQQAFQPQQQNQLQGMQVSCILSAGKVLTAGRLSLQTQQQQQQQQQQQERRPAGWSNRQETESNDLGSSSVQQVSAEQPILKVPFTPELAAAPATVEAPSPAARPPLAAAAGAAVTTVTAAAAEAHSEPTGCSGASSCSSDRANIPSNWSSGGFLNDAGAGNSGSRDELGYMLVAALSEETSAADVASATNSSSNSSEMETTAVAVPATKQPIQAGLGYDVSAPITAEARIASSIASVLTALVSSSAAQDMSQSEETASHRAGQDVPESPEPSAALAVAAADPAIVSAAGRPAGAADAAQQLDRGLEQIDAEVKEHLDMVQKLLHDTNRSAESL